MSVEFEWDAQKARSNLRKHGVDFADCVSVFFDDLAITINDSSSDEERFITTLSLLVLMPSSVFSWLSIHGEENVSGSSQLERRRDVNASTMRVRS